MTLYHFLRSVSDSLGIWGDVYGTQEVVLRSRLGALSAGLWPESRGSAWDATWLILDEQLLLIKNTISREISRRLL